MAHVAMDTNNPLGQRPYRAMGGLGETWNLSEQDRSWIVRDTETAPVEHMRVPPELLHGIPGTVFLYRPGVDPELLGMNAHQSGPEPTFNLPVVKTAVTPVPIVSSGGLQVQPTPVLPYRDCFGRPSASPGVCMERVFLPPIFLPAPETPPPAHPTDPLAPSPRLMPVNFTSPPSTQTVVPLATAQPPSFSSVVPGGQPASSASPIISSWFTDPAQEVIGGVPNWGLVAGGLVLAMMLKKGKR